MDTNNISFTKDELKIFTQIYSSNWGAVPRRYKSKDYCSKRIDEKIEQFIADNISTKDWNDVRVCLVDNFDRMCMPLPDNFEDILEFVYWDVHETADREKWNVNDVSIAFRRWIESQSNEQ